MPIHLQAHLMWIPCHKHFCILLSMKITCVFLRVASRDVRVENSALLTSVGNVCVKIFSFGVSASALIFKKHVWCRCALEGGGMVHTEGGNVDTGLSLGQVQVIGGTETTWEGTRWPRHRRREFFSFLTRDLLRDYSGIRKRLTKPTPYPLLSLRSRGVPGAQERQGQGAQQATVTNRKRRGVGGGVFGCLCAVEDARDQPFLPLPPLPYSRDRCSPRKEGGGSRDRKENRTARTR